MYPRCVAGGHSLLCPHVLLEKLAAGLQLSLRSLLSARVEENAAMMYMRGASYLTDYYTSLDHSGRYGGVTQRHRTPSRSLRCARRAWT
jgi:hypothetical protein